MSAAEVRVCLCCEVVAMIQFLSRPPHSVVTREGGVFGLENDITQLFDSTTVILPLTQLRKVQTYLLNSC